MLFHFYMSTAILVVTSGVTLVKNTHNKSCVNDISNAGHFMDIWNIGGTNHDSKLGGKSRSDCHVTTYHV